MKISDSHLMFRFKRPIYYSLTCYVILVALFIVQLSRYLNQIAVDDVFRGTAVSAMILGALVVIVAVKLAVDIRNPKKRELLLQVQPEYEERRRKKEERDRQ